VSIELSVLQTEVIENLTLAELFNDKSLSKNQFPLNVELHQGKLAITSTAIEHNHAVTNNIQQQAVKTTELAELVLFSNATVASLLAMFNVCQITPKALNAINHRNQLTSFRFAIETEDLTNARQQLSAFTVANNMEATLILHAPLLSMPGVLVMDMDSTTIEIECIDEIAALAGVGEQVAEVTELAMQGQLDFAQSLHQRVATLADAPESILQEVVNTIPLMPGLESLIAILKQHQWKVAIASGGFTYFADYLKDKLSLDAAFANTLEIVEGKLTGKVLGDVVDANVKAQCLTQLCQEYKIAQTQSVAMGDGANDLTMMAAANLGVAFHAKPLVQKQADATINFAGLDCLVHWLK